MPAAHLLPRWSYRSTVMSADCPLPSLVRFVLVALDNYRSDKSPVPYPSQRMLAVDTALSERAVRDALAQAEEHGWVIRVPRWKQGGGRMTDGYELLIPAGIPAKGSAMAIPERPAAMPTIPAPDAGGIPARGARELSIRTVQKDRIDNSRLREPQNEQPNQVPTPIRDVLKAAFGDGTTQGRRL